MFNAADVLALIHEMGRTDITLAQDQLLEDGLMSSLEIFGLITLIEERYQISLDASQLTPESLSSCERIAQLVAPALGEA